MEICIATLAFSLNLSYYLFSIYIRGNTKTSLCYSKLLISIIYFQERKIYLFNLSNQVKIIHFDKFLLTFVNFYLKMVNMLLVKYSNYLLILQPINLLNTKYQNLFLKSSTQNYFKKEKEGSFVVIVMLLKYFDYCYKKKRVL